MSLYVTFGIYLKYHDIGYHYMLMTLNYLISFKGNNPLASLLKLNNCISDIRVWMTKNKLKINNSKTEFIVLDLLRQSSLCR